MIVRHAEKPPLAGVTADGAADKNSLSVRGWQRAGALVPFFTRPSAPGVDVPTYVYAAKSDADDDDAGHGVRSIETVTPLVDKLAATHPEVSLNTHFGVGDESALLSDVESRAGIILIAWEHHHIPLIGAKLSSDVPDKWPETRFDLVWVFLRCGGGGYIFSQVPQLLLGGDEAA
ncbi:MAG: phosphoglycerate mutase family protein [Vulcanimicrobiaceae bacterium]